MTCTPPLAPNHIFAPQMLLGTVSNVPIIRKKTNVEYQRAVEIATVPWSYHLLKSSKDPSTTASQ